MRKGLVSSASMAKRLIEQGGVEINGEKMIDPNQQITIKNNMVIRCGKRKFVRITIGTNN